MKKLLLLLAVVFSTVACSNLSDELATANDRIASLEGQINTLEQQLQDSINANTITAQQLVDAQAEVTALLDQLETAYEANINLGNINGELWDQLYALEAQIADFNNQIASLQGQLADALEAEELNTELISSLNEQIAALEAQEPEVIIEYIETIVEVIQEVIVEVPVDYTDYTTIAELTATIQDLQQQLSSIPVDYGIAWSYGSTWLEERVGSSWNRANYTHPSIPNVRVYSDSDYGGYTTLYVNDVEVHTVEIGNNGYGRAGLNAIIAWLIDNQQVLTAETADEEEETTEEVETPTYADVSVGAYHNFVGYDIVINFDTGENVSGHNPGDPITIKIGDYTLVTTVNGSTAGMLSIRLDLTQELLDALQSGDQIDLYL